VADVVNEINAGVEAGLNGLAQGTPGYFGWHRNNQLCVGLIIGLVERHAFRTNCASGDN
jgi:hypothetical protein